MLVACLRCNRHVDTGRAAAGETVQCSCGLGILVPDGPAEAGKMNCPACGAPVDPDLQKCTFCDTRLATVICPGCFGTVFEGVKHCPHCGEVVVGRVVIHGETSSHCCPRCAESLRVEVVSGTPLERCAKCEGLWVDRETVDKIYKSREQTVAIGKIFQPDGPPPKKISRTRDGYLKCPNCEKLMNRKNFGRYSGVLVDICNPHGTWFDADELRHVLEFIASGGLEKAAKKEKMALEEEIRALEAKKSVGSARGTLGADLDLGVTRSWGGRGAIAIAAAILRRLF